MPLDSHVVAQLSRVLASLEQLLPKAVPAIDWTSCPAANWRRHSLSGYLEPMLENDGVTLDGLLGIDEQKRVVEENTRQFLAGHPANNILLWGSRGTGKSTLVRALLNQYTEQGLRIVQVDKEDLIHLPDIFSLIAPHPLKFIIFCDDLSFEEGEKGYKVLKSALDGSVYASPANTLIYVTSNRRHLLPEYKSDNFGSYMKGGEIHHGETVEEKISLSDRFGLWVAFSPFDQEHYLKVVRHCIAVLAGESGTEVIWNRDSELAAIAWSHDKSKSCGRTALQFAKHWVGQQLLHGHTSQS